VLVEPSGAESVNDWMERFSEAVAESMITVFAAQICVGSRRDCRWAGVASDQLVLMRQSASVC
jgi:hypothetical protein